MPPKKPSARRSREIKLATPHLRDCDDPLYADFSIEAVLHFDDYPLEISIVRGPNGKLKASSPSNQFMYGEGATAEEALRELGRMIDFCHGPDDEDDET